MDEEENNVEEENQEIATEQDIEDAERAHEEGEVTGRIAEYARRLYYWYSIASFFSGEITVVGHPDYRVGNRLLYRDAFNDKMWEFYIESVEHDFSFQEGYTTTLGVTRGLKIEHEDDDGGRFNPPQGEPELFRGGYLGEASFATMISIGEQLKSGSASATTSSDDEDEEAGEDVADSADELAESSDDTAYSDSE